MYKGEFRIEDWLGPYAGYTSGERSNGGATPSFEHEVGLNLVEDWKATDWEGLEAHYDAEHDQFCFRSDLKENWECFSGVSQEVGAKRERSTRSTLFAGFGKRRSSPATVKCCKRFEARITNIFTDEVMTTLADRLTTPLQLILGTWRALQEAYIIGQKPVDTEIRTEWAPQVVGLTRGATAR